MQDKGCDSVNLLSALARSRPRMLRNLFLSLVASNEGRMLPNKPPGLQCLSRMVP